jgi:hypothetical protein
MKFPPLNEREADRMFYRVAEDYMREQQLLNDEEREAWKKRFWQEQEDFWKEREEKENEILK